MSAAGAGAEPVRAVVTGAGGFAGAWLCRALRQAGRQVIGWVRRPPAQALPGVVYRVQDLGEGREVASALRADAPVELFHLGALSNIGDCSRDPDRAIAVNVGGTEQLLAALPPGARMLFVSSCHVYGRPEWLPLDEDHPLAPENLYARTKELGERLCLAAARSGRHVVIARPFHHTGPGQTPRYALADWAAQLAARRAGESTEALRVGDLSLRRDFTDVRDIVAGYRLLLDRAQAGAIVQLCSGSAPTLGELLTTLSGGALPPVQVRPERIRPDDIAELRGNPALAESLGWERRHSLDETLAGLLRGAAETRDATDRRRSASPLVTTAEG